MARLKGGWEVWGLAALLLVHVVLGVYWSVTIPILEAHDEDGHYFFVRYLATQHRLPPPGARSIANVGNDQLHQPPLYYVLAAIPVALVDLDDEFVPKYNPYIGFSDAQGGGLNKVVHRPEVEGWPYRGDVLGIHLARWVSVLLGILPLVFTFLTARALLPDQPWVRWGAVLAHAFWPQYRFSTAVINNDIMISACMGAATWLTVRLVVSQRRRALTLLALVAVAAVGLLAKNNGLAMVPVTVLALVAAIVSARGAMRRRVLEWALGALLPSSALVGLWYLRNVSGGSGMFGSYRSLSLISRLVEGTVTGTRAFRWDLVWPTLRHALISLWAGFGWNNVGLPAPYYWAAAAWAAGGVVGVLAWILRRPGRRAVAAVGALSLIIGCLLGMTLFYWVASGQTSMQGRYFLPALTAICTLLSVGWSTLCRRRLRPVAWGLMGTALAALAVVGPSAYICPVYAAPPEASEAQLSEYTPIHATVGGFVEIVGYHIEDPFVDPGGVLKLGLACRVLATSESNYTLRVKVNDREETLGEVQGYPGHGALATSTWRPGYVYVERMCIPVADRNKPGREAWVDLSFHGPEDAEVRDAGGESVGKSLRLARIKVRGTSPSMLDGPPQGFRFGSAFYLTRGRAELSSEGAGSKLKVELDWVAAGGSDVDYAVSIQLRDPRGDLLAQVDGDPCQGMNPTSLWERGESIRDQYVLPVPNSLPAGPCTVYACMYERLTSKRLAVTEPPGQQTLPGDELPLLMVRVDAGGAPYLVPICPSMQTKAQEKSAAVGG